MEPWYTKIAGLIPRKFVNGVVIVVVLLVIWNFNESDSSVDETVRDTTGEVVEAGTVGALAFQLGDCLVFPSSYSVNEESSITKLEVVPCTELHDAQIVGEYLMNDGDFPGDAFITEYEKANNICWDKYDAYTKTSLDAPPHSYNLLHPSEESWLQGDRELQCLFSRNDGGKLGASLEG
jgi:hypothetical protein